jgi:hypothetical protein
MDMDDPLRTDALRLLRVARDIYVEEHGGDEESFRARTSLDLVAAGQHTGLPTGYPSHEDAIEWLEDRGAIEPDPMFRRGTHTLFYRVTARGMELLGES